LVDEMKRVARPGGQVFLSTPNPLRLRDVHSRRLLGDFVRRAGYPWATLPWHLRAMVSDWENAPIDVWVVRRTLERTGMPGRMVPAPVARAIMWTRPWQKILVRKPEHSEGSDADSLLRKPEHGEGSDANSVRRKPETSFHRGARNLESPDNLPSLRRRP
jgi:hypothetical protein